MSNALLIAATVSLTALCWGVTCAAMKGSKKKTKLSVLLVPQGTKQWFCFVAVILSLTCLLCMLLFYYKSDALFVVKHELLLAVLWPVAVSDYIQMRIPNKVLLIGLAARVIIALVEFIVLGSDALPVFLLEAIALGFAFAITVGCALLSRGSLGMGDIKLFCLMALFLGTEGLFYAAFLSIVVAFFAAIGLLLTKKKKRKDTIPFAPFVLLGTFLSFILTGT